MTAMQSPDRDWDEVSAYFMRWLSGRGRVVIDRTDQLNFGNRIVEAVANSLKIRLVRDRGTVLLDLSLGRNWHSGRNVLAFHDGLSPSDVFHSCNPDGAVLELGIGRIKQLLVDPRLGTFEQAIGQFALNQLSADFRAPAPRTAMPA